MTLAAVMGTDALPEAEKDYDRVLISSIPAILEEAGYTVARL